MRHSSILLAALAAASFAGMASAQLFAAPPQLSGGPSDEEIAAAWPAAAKQAGVEGEARIQCRVSAKGVMDGCQVLQETPAGRGFGQAALGLTSRFKAEPGHVGAQASDGIVRFILRFPPAAPPMGPETVGPYTFPQAVEKPTDDQIYAAWPGVARANHVEGSASMSCVVSLYGRLEACKVTDERPAGLGFGEGVLRLKDNYRFLPGTKDTMSVSMRMSVQVQFECKSRCTPVKLPDNFVGKLVSVAWSQVPTAAELAVASPKGLAADGPNGKALLFCRLERSGGAGRCKVLSEEPRGAGVGDAALSLVPKFRAQVSKEFDGAGVQIPISFSNELGRPVLMRRPSSEDFAPLGAKAAADPKVTEASVMLSCTVGASGLLVNCSASQENPSGLGLGEAALALAPKFSVSQWGENGRPTLGGSIKVPLGLAVRDPPKATDAPVVNITDPQWTSRPSAADVERFYPPRALDALASGVTKLRCKANGAGELYGCEIISETPIGMGFGEAALKMSRLFRMKPPSIEGHAVEGATVEVPIVFRVE